MASQRRPCHSNSWFVVGELRTIQQTRSDIERRGCMHLLERVAYWKLRGAPWRQIRAFYAAIVAGIENHELDWTTSFVDHESFMIDRPPISAMVKPDKPFVKKKADNKDVWFCKDFNMAEGCLLSAPHSVVDSAGKDRQATHICSKCWRLRKVKAAHSALADDCPNRV